MDGINFRPSVLLVRPEEATQRLNETATNKLVESGEEYSFLLNLFVLS